MSGTPEAAAAAAPDDGGSEHSKSPSTQPSSHIEVDDFFDDDEAYSDTNLTSYVTSIASSIRRGIEENGRLYAAYGQHKPWIPVDDDEVSLLELSSYNVP